jgi:hypothetical protein
VDGVTIEIVGTEKVERDLAGMSERLLDMQPVFREEIRMLEAAEAARFDDLGGQYVDTGATRSSLTSSASSDAVRELTPHGLAFGSSVYYARFLVEHPGPVTEKGGLKRPPPSAILKLEPEQAAQIARDVGDHVMGRPH